MWLNPNAILLFYDKVLVENGWSELQICKRYDEWWIGNEKHCLVKLPWSYLYFSWYFTRARNKLQLHKLFLRLVCLSFVQRKILRWQVKSYQLYFNLWLLTTGVYRECCVITCLWQFSNMEEDSFLRFLFSSKSWITLLLCFHLCVVYWQIAIATLG